MIKKEWIGVFSLFTSLSTLLCCALPALLVSLGAGAVLASIVSVSPWLVSLSKYKVWAFAFAGIMLLVAAVIRYKFADNSCPADPEKARLCMRLRKINSVIFYSSVAIYLIGFFFAFVAVHIFF